MLSTLESNSKNKLLSVKIKNSNDKHNNKLVYNEENKQLTAEMNFDCRNKHLCTLK